MPMSMPCLMYHIAALVLLLFQCCIRAVACGYRNPYIPFFLCTGLRAYRYVMLLCMRITFVCLLFAQARCPSLLAYRSLKATLTAMHALRCSFTRAYHVM